MVIELSSPPASGKTPTLARRGRVIAWGELQSLLLAKIKSEEPADDTVHMKNKMQVCIFVVVKNQYQL